MGQRPPLRVLRRHQKPLPVEKDYRHWKELYEMQCRKTDAVGERLEAQHEAELSRWKSTAQAWQEHAMFCMKLASIVLAQPRPTGRDGANR